jgi:hypothetical protein
MICKDLRAFPAAPVDNFVGNHPLQVRKRLLGLVPASIASFPCNRFIFNEINNLASNHGKRHAAVQRSFTQ